jgi:hypothetical protein
MMVGRRVAAFLIAVAALRGPKHAGAQTVTLAISALVADSTSPAPFMTVTGFPTRPELGPYTVSLAIANEPIFRNPFFFKSADGTFATFTMDSLMAEHATVYFRARLVDASGTVVAQATAQHPVRSWLRLVSPIHGPTTLVGTSSPEFVWDSPPITLPPGLWQYDLSVFNTRTGVRDFFKADLSETSYTFTEPLEANTSYSWQVRAHAVNSRGAGEARVSSPGTFIVASPGAPIVTLFYSNFPNPFGRGTRSMRTCFWFDLARPSKVKITIYDIRQRVVRHILPSSPGDAALPVGGYGRENIDTQTGCNADNRLSWDGRDDGGRFVPPGVYLVVFEGDGTRSSVKMVFKGQ